MAGHAQKTAAFEALRFGVAALLLAIALATAFAHLGLTRLGLAVLISGFAAAIGIWWWHRRQAAAFNATSKAARLAERLAPELGSSASAAVDLAPRLAAGQEFFSKPLAQWHLERTAKTLQSLDLSRRYGASRQRWQKRAHVTVLSAAALAAVALLTLDTGRRRLLASILEPNAVQLSDVPLAGDIRIVYRYPAYTNQPPRTVEGGDGSISAVVGTEVQLAAVATEPVREAFLRVSSLDGEQANDIPMQVSEQRHITATFPLLQDGRYHFSLVTKSGDRLQERQTHSIRAMPDAYPEIYMDQPKSDVELRDNQQVAIAWRAADDFGVGEVNLVIEASPEGEPKRIKLAGGDGVQIRREGTYKWSLVELQVAAGAGVRFYLEAFDNDTVGGPKRSVSDARRVEMFSARKHHEDLLAQQLAAKNAMVDLLGHDLTSPSPQTAASKQAMDKQQGILERMQKVAEMLHQLAGALRDDELVKDGVVEAFVNIQSNIDKARLERQRLVLQTRRTHPSSKLFVNLAQEQASSIGKLEGDIIYLDDLLAMQKVQIWKQTAQELLSAQHDLQELLSEYKETQDPSLKAALEQRIRDLKNQMMELMAKMAQIKEALPSEYRNMESASQLKLQEQMDRLEQMLREGNLDQAAQELEDIARMLENMMGQMDDAAEQFGDEKYSEIRQELSEFAAEFQQLESEQQALAKRQEEALREYRRQAVQQAGKDLDDFVKKARAQTAEALQSVERMAHMDSLLGMDRDIQEIHQRLFDLDSLLDQRDFAEAREVAEGALQSERTLNFMLRDRVQRYGSRHSKEILEARKHADAAQKNTETVKDMLDKLFPEPKDVLNKEQMAQLDGMTQKQQQLEGQAKDLEERMQGLSEQLPLFGGEPQQNLQDAQGEMGQASEKLKGRSLPQAAGHGRRAAEELGKLRQALEQASQGGQGGLPLPLGQGQGRGRGGQGGQMSREEVEIPDAGPAGGGPRFRQELLEAAKQKAPESYEDAVRRYYEELIR